MRLNKITILLVEDNPDDADLLQEVLAEVISPPQFKLSHLKRLSQTLKRLDNEHFDIILLDLALPDSQGLDTLLRVHRQAPSVPIIVLTGPADESLASKALRLGAQDYLVKGQVDSDLLLRTMRNAIDRKRTEEALRESEARFRTTIEHNAAGVIKQSDNHIEVNSQPPQGTTVRPYLPQIEGTAASMDRDQLAAGPLRGSETILLVEDEDLVRELAHRILHHHGYTVLEARQGKEALQICEQHEGQIQLLLTDVVMPGGMSGGELAQRLARHYPAMKVLYMSGYTDNVIIKHGVLEPGLAFLQKPFTPDALARKVREALDA